MNFFLRSGGISVKPYRALELTVVADGVPVRVELERSAVNHFVGADACNEEAVADFVHRNRKGLERAIEAHLIAYGIPLDQRLVMTLDDLRKVEFT